MEKHFVQASIKINATAAKAWDILSNPEKILLYTGSKTETDWKAGSTISWRGELHGRAYENKGKVLENIPGRLLKFTYWSGIGGDEDKPENYSQITYTLLSLGVLSIQLDYPRINIPTALEKQIFEAHLPSLLEEIKRLCEE